MTSVDGRVERRERNRSAVVEALLDLYREGDLSPSAGVIARRAGVSPRSLFRYFDDVDALVQEAIGQQQARLAPRMDVRLEPTRPLAERVAQLVDARLELYAAMGSVARVGRSVAHNQPRVAAELARLRSVLREQVAAGFEPELRTRGAEALAAADVLTSWEAVDLLLHDHGLDRDAVAATLITGLLAVLA
jgi:AcrR family transcriptional regulator